MKIIDFCRCTMINRIAIAGVIFAASLTPEICTAQTQILSTSPPTVEYQYQLYYPRFWGGWGGGYGGYGGGYGGWGGGYGGWGGGYGGWGGGYGGWGGGYGGWGWAGPGLSLGGSLPAQGREGISSFYGRPMMPPFGSGVYVNSYTYATQLPGFPNTFGLAANGGAVGGSPSAQAGIQASGFNTTGMGGAGMMPANGLPSTLQRATQGAAVRPDPSRGPVRISSSETLEKARQMISFGDEKLKTRQWTQAYVNYRNAALVADDLADAHLRLAVAALSLNRFPESAMELKRALFIDPTAARSDETLAGILGPDSRPVRMEMTRSVAQWARGDLRDQDRLFLLGAVLQLDGDKRAPEILQAAYQLTGGGDHVLALMSTPSTANTVVAENAQPPVPVPPETQKLPELHQRPLALH